jgi:hypothetical protein
VGTDYNHEAFGLLQALERKGEVTLYFDENGNYGINSSAREGELPAKKSDNDFLIKQIRYIHNNHPIDFVIGTFLASTISVETLAEIRKLGIPVINMVLDDRLPNLWSVKVGVKMGAIGLVEGVDIALQTTKEFVTRYILNGCPTIYWPLASDPNIFKPRSHKDIDVVFVGNNYGKRGGFINEIKSAGINIECYGRGFSNGYLSGDKVPEVFSRSKIILGTGLVGHSSTITTLKLRDFDGPISGALYITSYNPDLEELYEIGRHIVVYKDIKECIEKIKYYLSNNREREAIASAGRSHAIKNHTWDMRLTEVINLLELRQ